MSKKYGETPTADDNYKEVYEFMGIDPKQVGKPVSSENPLEELKIEDGNPKEAQPKYKKSELKDEDIELEGEDNEESESEEEGEEELEEGEDSLEEPEEEEPKNKNDYVPVKSLINEKAKTRELKRRLAKLEEKVLDQEDIESQNTIYQDLVDEGMDEGMAKKLAVHTVRLAAKNRKTDSYESSITDELTDLSEDDYFADALDYKIPIIKKMRDYRKKGITISAEEAYLTVVGADKLKGKTKVRERKKAAAKQLENKRSGRSQYKKVAAGDSSGPKSQYKLDSDDMKALQGLQKAQPFAGWTKAKYYKMKNSD